MKELIKRLRQPLSRLYHTFHPYDRWVKNVYGPANVGRRRDLLLTVATFAHMNRPIKGYYFEFGCHDAKTIRMAWDCFHWLFDWDFVAFDSFEGFPPIAEIDRQEIWQAGKLKTEEKDFIAICRRHGIDRLRTVKGFYNESLTAATAETLAGKPAAVIYVDCDLYESTVPVLEFCRSFLQVGTVIVFDAWTCFWADPNRGEQRAWREFQERYPDLKFRLLCENGIMAAFVCVEL
jgi:O-methyltransferase